MLKNREKNVKNLKQPGENRQKCRKTGEKPSKISKNRINVKNTPKMSKNLKNPSKNIGKS